jgi:hypothetical protein
MEKFPDHYKLYQLHFALASYYEEYVNGKITLEAYLEHVKPLDIAISKLEMTILQDTVESLGSSLPHILRPEY